jgi:hypothetical protein
MYFPFNLKKISDALKKGHKKLQKDARPDFNIKLYEFVSHTILNYHRFTYKSYKTPKN